MKITNETLRPLTVCTWPAADGGLTYRAIGPGESVETSDVPEWLADQFREIGLTVTEEKS